MFLQLSRLGCKFQWKGKHDKAAFWVFFGRLGIFIWTFHILRRPPCVRGIWRVPFHFSYCCLEVIFLNIKLWGYEKICPSPLASINCLPRLLPDTSTWVKGHFSSVMSRGPFGGPSLAERVSCGAPFGSLWSKGPVGLNRPTQLRNTCDNDVIWVHLRPAQQLLTLMM